MSCIDAIDLCEYRFDDLFRRTRILMPEMNNDLGAHLRTGFAVPFGERGT